MLFPPWRQHCLPPSSHDQPLCLYIYIESERETHTALTFIIYMCIVYIVYISVGLSIILFIWNFSLFNIFSSSPTLTSIGSGIERVYRRYIAASHPPLATPPKWLASPDKDPNVTPSHKPSFWLRQFYQQQKSQFFSSYFLFFCIHFFFFSSFERIIFINIFSSKIYDGKI